MTKQMTTTNEKVHDDDDTAAPPRTRPSPTKRSRGEEDPRRYTCREMRNRTGTSSKNGGSISSIRNDGDSNSSKKKSKRPRHSPGGAAKTKIDAMQDDWDDDLAHMARSSIVTPRTIQASAVLVVAMAIAISFNAWENNRGNGDGVPDLTTARFLSDFCQLNDGPTSTTCHSRIQPYRRTQRSTGVIRKGEAIVTIPRHLMILDVDALQDPYIQQHWAGKMTTSGDGGQERRIDVAAFLAVHLARLLQSRRQQLANSTHDHVESTATLLDRYLDVLASTHVTRYHPLVLNETFVEQNLRHTSSLDVWRMHLTTIAREYEVLTKAATTADVAKALNFDEYREARLLVLTRAFGTGPPPLLASGSAAEAAQHGGDVRHRRGEGSSRMLRELESQFNVDLSSGSYAMVPVLDFYDHHAAPNVGFEFKFRHERQHHHNHHHDDDDSNVLYGDGYFHITALETIGPQTTMYDSYGLRTDSDLFARYGFVQGDGTDYTQASVALHPLDFRQQSRRPTDFVVRQRGQILRYLQFDDGYPECVVPRDESAASELKRLKYLYLLRRADHIPSWTVVMHPRRQQPAPSDTTSRSSQPQRHPLDSRGPDFELPPFDLARPPPVMNGTSAFTTCRIISLLDTDYDGHAITLLERLVNDTTSHSLPPLGRRHRVTDRMKDDGKGSWEDALEYRTLHCMTRMVAAAARRMNTTVETETSELRRLQTDESQRQQQQHPSWEWHFGHLRLGEVATLTHLRSILHGRLRKWHEPHRSMELENRMGYMVRRDACPREALDPLFEQYGTASLYES